MSLPQTVASVVMCFFGFLVLSKANLSCLCILSVTFVHCAKSETSPVICLSDFLHHVIIPCDNGLFWFCHTRHCAKIPTGSVALPHWGCEIHFGMWKFATSVNGILEAIWDMQHFCTPIGSHM